MIAFEGYILNENEIQLIEPWSWFKSEEIKNNGSFFKKTEFKTTKTYGIDIKFKDQFNQQRFNYETKQERDKAMIKLFKLLKGRK